VEERLLLQLLQLLRPHHGVEGVWPQVRPVDEGGTQSFVFFNVATVQTRPKELSSEWVHERWLGDCLLRQNGLRFGHLGVGLGELQPDGLGQVGVETHALTLKEETKRRLMSLQVLLGGLGPGAGAEGDEAHGGGRLSVLRGHFQQTAFVALIRSEE